MGEQTRGVCVQWRIGFGHMLAVKVPIYSVVSKGVSWANKGWDVLSCRGKTAGLFCRVSRVRGHLLRSCFYY